MMISVVVCSADFEINSRHKAHTISSAGQSIEYITIDNSKNNFGICSAYNYGVKKASGDIILFLHEDVFIIQQGWALILEEKFLLDRQLAAIGVAGTSYLSEKTPFWLAFERPFIHGKVIHQNPINKELSLAVYSEPESDAPVAALDGLFIATRKELFEMGIAFDEKTFPGFHLYDIDICMQILSLGTIRVTHDILVKHISKGSYSDSWKEAANRFIVKYKNHLPISITNLNPNTTVMTPWHNIDFKKISSPETFEFIHSL